MKYQLLRLISQVKNSFRENFTIRVQIEAPKVLSKINVNFSRIFNFIKILSFWTLGILNVWLLTCLILGFHLYGLILLLILIGYAYYEFYYFLNSNNKRVQKLGETEAIFHKLLILPAIFYTYLMYNIYDQSPDFCKECFLGHRGDAFGYNWEFIYFIYVVCALYLTWSFFVYSFKRASFKLIVISCLLFHLPNTFARQLDYLYTAKPTSETVNKLLENQFTVSYISEYNNFIGYNNNDPIRRTPLQKQIDFACFKTATIIYKNIAK